MNFGYENSVNKSQQIEAVWAAWNAFLYFFLLKMRKKTSDYYRFRQFLIMSSINIRISIIKFDISDVMRNFENCGKQYYVLGKLVQNLCCLLGQIFCTIFQIWHICYNMLKSPSNSSALLKCFQISHSIYHSSPKMS